jgi:hypothetical protein
MGNTYYFSYFIFYTKQYFEAVHISQCTGNQSTRMIINMLCYYSTTIFVLMLDTKKPHPPFRACGYTFLFIDSTYKIIR